MKRNVLLAALLASSLLRLAAPACAEFYPGYGYGGWGGENGAAALLGADYRQSAVIQSAAQSRLAGQQAAIGQNAVVQSGIRSTLSNEAQSRDAAIQRQQQSTQDWWFQQQSQQMAQQRSASYGSAAAAPYAGYRGFGPSGSPPPAAMDIIKWPTLLQEPCFAAERTQIEAPYRRTPPRLSMPAKADYAPDGTSRRGHEGYPRVASE